MNVGVIAFSSSSNSFVQCYGKLNAVCFGIVVKNCVTFFIGVYDE